jgi:hypothetical protein
VVPFCLPTLFEKAVWAHLPNKAVVSALDQGKGSYHVQLNTLEEVVRFLGTDACSRTHPQGSHSLLCPHGTALGMWQPSY